MIEKLEHVGLSVADMERSLAFYRDTLGMEVVMDLDFQPESKLGEIVGMAGASARVVHLRCGETILELFEYRNPRGRLISDDRQQADHGFVHIGLKVTEIHELYDSLLNMGIRFLSPPVELRPGAWIAYFKGPDGEVCELRQTPGN
ncbi:MAG: VOC family protein [Armatimonadota bacterium]